jgi:hypothetical protein
VNDYVKKYYTKNENEIKTKMIDGKTNKNDNENESLNENSTGPILSKVYRVFKSTVESLLKCYQRSPV